MSDSCFMGSPIPARRRTDEAGLAAELREVRELVSLAHADLVALLSGTVTDEDGRREMIARSASWLKRALARGGESL